jgi:serine/threonine-protein kinase TTK/MPS1
VKKVSLVDADASTRKSFLDEIDLLKRLQTYERIIKLIDYQYEENAEFLHIILEFAEIDLARTLEEFKVYTFLIYY